MRRVRAYGRARSCPRSRGFVPTVAGGVAEFVPTVAGVGRRFVPTVAERGCKCPDRKKNSTGKENDLKGNDLKPLVIRIQF